MKKFTHLFLLLIALQLTGYQLFSQTNYYGVSGNMVTGDFDNDGILDDIAAFNTSGELPVLTLWNSNNGWMEESQADCQLPFDFLSARSLNSKIVAGDFDNDGFLDDIASIYEVGQNKTSLTVWVNNNGVFEPMRWWYGGDFDANQVAQTIVVGDFDHDGFVDDIAAFYNYDQLRTKVYVWNSNGKKFGWPGTWWTGNDFNSTRIQGTVVSGDFDHNGFVDDIAALYNYVDDYCKVFVWTTKGKKFGWPYTWFAEDNFVVANVKNSMVSGDFNNNGFVDNIAALYTNNANSSSLLVFERANGGFEIPDTWWYGNNEAVTSKTRLVSADINGNNRVDQITGLTILGDVAAMNTWTAEDHTFSLPENNWQGVALGVDNYKNNSEALSNEVGNRLNLYPNPSNGQFTVDIPNFNGNNVNVTIYTVLGSQIDAFQSLSGIELQLDLSDLEPGTYSIKVTGKDFTANRNFIVE